MANLFGARSTYDQDNPSVADNPQKRNTGDTISSQDWNLLGDGIYNLEQSLLTADANQKRFELNRDCNHWAANLPIGWFKPVDGWMSVTGSLVIPLSGCLQLGTFQPLRRQNLVKVQLSFNMPFADRSFTGNAITTAIWCPSNNPTLVQAFNSTHLTSSDGRTFNPGNFAYKTDVFWRTIYVGASFGGYEPPDNLNTFTQHVSVLILSPTKF